MYRLKGSSIWYTSAIKGRGMTVSKGVYGIAVYTQGSIIKCACIGYTNHTRATSSTARVSKPPRIAHSQLSVRGAMRAAEWGGNVPDTGELHHDSGDLPSLARLFPFFGLIIYRVSKARIILSLSSSVSFPLRMRHSLLLVA